MTYGINDAAWGVGGVKTETSEEEAWVDISS